MKKLLSILLCAAILASLTPTAFAATGVYKNVLSETTWDFSESSDAATYGRVDATETSPIVIADGAGYDGSKALSITRGSDNKNANISFLDHASSSIKVSDVEVKFKFMVTGQDALFKFVFRDTGDYNPLACQGGNVTFLGQNVAKYSKNKWYDVEMFISINRGYGQLRFREITDPESAWSEYYIFAGNTFFSGKTETSRLAIGVQNSAVTAYVDDYYQNTADKPLKFLRSDDFSNGIGNWTTGNMIDTIYAQQVDVNGNKMLEIKADNAAEKKNTSVYQNISSITTTAAVADTNYYFKFKLGGNAKPGTIGASLQTNNSGTNTEYFIARVIDNDLRLFGGLTNLDNVVDVPASFGVPTETNLYDVEALYRPSESKLTVIVTNDKGVQFTVTTSQWSGTPNKFAFRHHVTEVGSTAVAHFDDFETDILDSNGPAFVDSKILSGNTKNASLDETAVFTYDRTIKQAELASAKVTLNSEKLSHEDYTITSKGNEVYVTLKNLTTATDYKVTLENVTDIVGVANENAEEISFTTSDVAIKAEKPELVGTKLTSNVTSYYANGKTIKFILAIYNDAETMIEAVKVIDVTVSDRNGKVEEADFSEILANAAGKKVKGFVWDSFGTMEPYALSYEGTYNN